MALHPVAWVTGSAWPWLLAHPILALGGTAALGYGGYRAWRARHAAGAPDIGPAPEATGPAPTEPPPHPSDDEHAATLVEQLTVQDPDAWALLYGWRERAAWDPYAAAWMNRLRNFRMWHAHGGWRGPGFRGPGFRGPGFHPGGRPPAPPHVVRSTPVRAPAPPHVVHSTPVRAFPHPAPPARGVVHSTPVRAR
jgi:hypothetical protein